jgi:hypothetical protein
METTDLANVARALLSPPATARNALTGQLSAMKQVFLEPSRPSRREENE